VRDHPVVYNKLINKIWHKAYKKRIEGIEKYYTKMDTFLCKDIDMKSS